MEIKKRSEIVHATKHAKWPMDFDLLDYGSIIPNSVIEEYFGVNEDNEDFRFKQIKFIQIVDMELRSRGKIATICIKNGKIKVLTHQEASEYNRKRFNCHVSGLARVHEKNMHVLSTELSKENRDDHTKTVMFQSKVLQSIIKTKDEFQLSSVQRRTPSLKPPERKNNGA